MTGMDMLVLRNRIFELTMLQDNWDSYGAKPVTAEAGKRMFSLLGALSGMPGIVTPTTEGGITAEWRDGGVAFIVEFTAEGELEVYWADEDVSAEQELK